MSSFDSMSLIFDYSSDESDNNSEQIELSSSEFIKAIKLYSSTVEVVGIICEIVAPRGHFSQTTRRESTLFKFVICNNDDVRIQVIVWDEDIERVINQITIGSIIHIDGAFAKKIPKICHYNKGNVPFELIIQSNTKINILGKAKIDYGVQETEKEYPVVKFDECQQYLKERILLRGFIKTNFDTVKNRHDSSLSCIGSLANESQFKIEVKIIQFETPFINPYKKGDHVEIRGVVKNIFGFIMIDIDSLADITKIDDKVLSVPQLINSNKEVRVLCSRNDSNKKFKHN